jgi:putative membrane protein
MKILKRFVVSTISLYIVGSLFSGLSFENGLTTLAITGAVLALASFLIRPVINLLLLPINLMTFGLFRWVTYALTLYLVTLIVPGFEIGTFAFAGYSSYWFSIPAFSFGGLVGLLLFSLSISFVSSTIFWIMK